MHQLDEEARRTYLVHEALQMPSTLNSLSEPGLIPETGGNEESKEFAGNTKMPGFISCALLLVLTQKKQWKDLRFRKPSM